MVRGAARPLLGLGLAGACITAAPAPAQVAYLGEDIGQQAKMLEGAPAEPDATGTDAGTKKKNDLIVAPIPVSNPALGTGAAVAAVLYYNPNHAPNPWVTGVAGGYTSTDTWGVGIVHQMSLAKDHVRINALAGYGDAKLKFYGVGDLADSGISVDLRDKGFLASIDAQTKLFDRGLLSHLYIGARASYIRVRSSVSIPTPNRPDLNLPSIELRSQVSAIGPAFTFDTRDDPQNPRRGVYATGNMMFGADFLGSDFEHRKLEIATNGFFALGKGTVLGIRKTLCGVKGKAPFYDLCLFGKQNDLRGYEPGRYRDGASWALQAEVRQHIVGKLGAVAFGGVGGIADSTDDIWKHSHVLASGGVGLRYLASRSNNVNLRFDVAWGKDGTAFYFGIGEAF